MNGFGNSIEKRWLVLFGLAWLGIVGAGLFVPLMDNDSAHHANIALRMYLTGDYVSLIDYDGPYLDKPHLHFWLAALSYHVFGVTGFAYKLPSFLLSLIGIFGVYRAGCILINKQAGIWSAIIYATSASFLLALNDVRMDAILTAAVAISIWQMAGYFSAGRFNYLIGTTLGMAIGFCTKGHMGVFVPLLFGLFYAFFTQKWNRVLCWKLIPATFLFAAFISPVVYCYYLQYNLHPEVVVRGVNEIDGVRFILWDQSLGRFSGEMGGDAKADKLFFIHTFLWVFAPWSLVGLGSVLYYRGMKKLTPLTKSVMGVLILFALIVGFSSFKLPHYLNVVLPLAALWIAGMVEREKIFILIAKGVEWLIWALVGVVSASLLIWWFPDQPLWFWGGLIIYFVLLFYVIIKRKSNVSGNLAIRLSMATLLIFWMMNAGFYPSLLKYQAGNVLSDRVEVQHIKDPIYSLDGFYSSSFYFYRKELRKEVGLETMPDEVKSVVMDKRQMNAFLQLNDGWKIKNSTQDYEITRLDVKFLDREKRKDQCNEVIIMTRN